MTSADDFVIQLAIDKGLVGEEQVDALRLQVDNPEDLTAPRISLLDALYTAHLLEPRQTAELLAAEFGMGTLDVVNARPSAEMLALIPRHLALKYLVFPVGQINGALQLAIADPLNVDALDDLAHILPMRIEPGVAPAHDIKHAIDHYFGREDSSVGQLINDMSVAGEIGTGLTSSGAVDGETNDGDAPIIKLVHTIILEAIQRRASDIHLEPLEKRFRVRYRIDGVLIETDSPPKRLQPALLSRVKLMANISIAEKRVPQDGRIQIIAGVKQIDLRVSSLPTVHGESIVMRILDKEGLKLGLPELGFLSDDQQVMERIISLPDGIFLVTGPTGSGKTTTLYSCLHYINKPDRKLITVEDPVEYQLAGVNQVPVRHEVGMTFASALRAMLRQAPNIVMVGEIRDLETAEIAINASLTGHMVFSTLHTNDAPSAVTRLIDIGVKPFLVSTSLRAAMAQRLVRKICKHCKRPYLPDPKELRPLGIQASQLIGSHISKGAGCPECNGTGCRGRAGIFEIFIVNDEIQRMIYENVSSSKLRERARQMGMRTMREDGARKVLGGMTTLDEVVSITVGDAS